ncbi:MAG: SDR family oxidoreductase [Anaerolineae bacterium]|nr:SDR family oxidoreductase [Anaerolineae bacterium]
MSGEQRVALVTGGNRGIGYEICRQLADRGYEVVLTARDMDKGAWAVKRLALGSRRVRFHRLDVEDEASVAEAARFMRDQYGRLDALVNNAGVYLDEGVSVFDVAMETFRTTMAINFYGALHLCRAFVPMMKERRYGRVVNVSSESGSLETMGGRTAAYAVSKTAMNALTRIVADEVRRWGDIKVNSMCPGWVRTEMGGASAPRSVEEGADTAVWLATLGSDGPTGGFFRDRKPIAW